jgi:hypothetical protein
VELPAEYRDPDIPLQWVDRLKEIQVAAYRKNQPLGLRTQCLLLFAHPVSSLSCVQSDPGLSPGRRLSKILCPAQGPT